MTREPATLSFLFWRVLRNLERAVAAQEAAVPSMPPLDLWANLLRVLTSDGADVRDLPSMVCLSKRAVRTRIATAVRRGWVEERKLGPGQTNLRLTPRGSDIATRWKSLQSAAEDQWQNETGLDRAARLRGALDHLVAQFPLEHPHYPASYGAADASITGRHGQDWKPVPRGPGDTVSDLPLYAMVSQAIVAYAMSYEERSPVALSLSTSILRSIPVAGLTVSQLRNSVGVSALVRHGFLRLSGSGSAQMAFLTAKGQAVSDAYVERVHAVEKEWQEQFGGETVRATRRALEELTEDKARLF